MAFWNEKIPQSFLNINYEDIIDNPNTEIKKLISFCGLEWHDDCLNFSKNMNPIKTVSVSQARNPIYKSSVKGFEKYEPYLKGLFEMVKKKPQFK